MRDSGVFLAGGLLPALTTVCTFANHAAAPPSPAIISVRRRLLRQAQAASTGRCHHRQAQAAALRNLPLRSIPSLVPAFMPGLSDIVARPGASRSAFAPPIHMAMGGHGFREGTACACLANHRADRRANITHRLLTGNSPATLRQLSGNSHDLRPPQPLYNSTTGTSGCIPVDGIGGWQSPKGIRCSLRGTPQSPYLPGVGQPFPDVTDQELKLRGRPFFILM